MPVAKFDIPTGGNYFARVESSKLMNSPEERPLRLKDGSRLVSQSMSKDV